MKRLLFLLAPVLLTGCAASPGSIAPTYVSSVGFQGYDCNQLAQEERRLSSALEDSSAQQEQTRTDDAVGVFFLLLPLGSMSGGNVAPQIAREKGELRAVQEEMLQRRCEGGIGVAGPIMPPAIPPGEQQAAAPIVHDTQGSGAALPRIEPQRQSALAKSEAPAVDFQGFPAPGDVAPAPIEAPAQTVTTRPAQN